MKTILNVCNQRISTDIIQITKIMKFYVQQLLQYVKRKFFRFFHLSFLG